MAISTTTNTVLLAGNSSTVVFPYSYPFYSTTDLQVYLFDTLAGGIVKQTLGNNYSVAATPDSTGIYPNGGNVVFTSSVVSTQIVVIDRQPIETQTFAILQNGYISSVGLVHQLDYLTLLIQDMQDRLTRTVAFPNGWGVNTSTFNPQLPTTANLASSAGLYLAINTSATGFMFTGSSTLPTGPSGYVWTGNGVGLPATFQQLNIGGSSVSGTLSLSNGGTGGLVPSEWGVVYASSATQLATTVPGPVGLPLMANASSAPSFQQLPYVTAGSGAIPTSLGGTGGTVTPPSWAVAVGSGNSIGYVLPAAGGQVLLSNNSSAPSFGFTPVANASGVLSIANGGTNQGSFNQYSLVYASVPSQLSGLSSVASGYPLISQGSAAPAYLPLSVNSGFVTGTLGIGFGGTGQTTANAAFNALNPMTTWGDLIAAGSGVVAKRIAAGSSGTVLQSFGPGADPGWVNATSGLQYTANQYGLVVSGSSNTQLNVIAPNSSTSMFMTSQGTAANPAWTALNAPPTVQYLTTLGSGTYTPTPGTVAIKVEVISGGGGGGGAAAGSSAVGGGGGGGNYAMKWIAGSSAMNSSYPFVIGAGGGGGAGSAGGNSGSSSIFGSSVLTSPIIVPPGTGGGGSPALTSATIIGTVSSQSGIVSGGDINLFGMQGAPGIYTSTAVGLTGYGGSAPCSYSTQTPPLTQNNNSSNGNNGANYGAGGSGASNLNSGGTQKTGGNGSQGIIVVWEFKA